MSSGPGTRPRPRAVFARRRKKRRLPLIERRSAREPPKRMRPGPSHRRKSPCGRSEIAPLEEVERFKAEFFRALTHPTRIRILELLSRGEKSVGELQHEMASEGSTVTQQLAILRMKNLVDTRKAGNSIYYRLRDPQLSDLIGRRAPHLRESRDRAAGHDRGTGVQRTACATGATRRTFRCRGAHHGDGSHHPVESWGHFVIVGVQREEMPCSPPTSRHLRSGGASPWPRLAVSFDPFLPRVIEAE